jgi:PilZ domain
VLSDSGRIWRGGKGAERRKHARTPLGLRGKLFIPARGIEDDCQVVDFSPDGAGVKSSISAPVGTQLVLYVEGFGRFEGTVVVRDRTRLGVQFQSSGVKRGRTAEQLSNFAVHGMTNRVRLRSVLRTKEIPALHDFVRADGRRASCEVVDVALGGASLKTNTKPEIGELLDFGLARGRVVRHTDEGIAVEFVTGIAADPGNGISTAGGSVP